MRDHGDDAQRRRGCCRDVGAAAIAALVRASVSGGAVGQYDGVQHGQCHIGRTPRPGLVVDALLKKLVPGHARLTHDRQDIGHQRQERGGHGAGDGEWPARQHPQQRRRWDEVHADGVLYVRHQQQAWRRPRRRALQQDHCSRPPPVRVRACPCLAGPSLANADATQGGARSVLQRASASRGPSARVAAAHAAGDALLHHAVCSASLMAVMVRAHGRINAAALLLLLLWRPRAWCPPCAPLRMLRISRPSPPAGVSSFVLCVASLFCVPLSLSPPPLPLSPPPLPLSPPPLPLSPCVGFVATGRPH